MVVAKIAGIDVEAVIDKDAKKMSPTGALPCLETAEGSIAGSTAIARYLATPELEGKSLFEQGQVDQWISVIRTSLLPSARTIGYMIFGHIPFDTTTYNNAYLEMKETLKMFNIQLKGKLYLTGATLTLADILLGVTLIDLYQGTLDTNFRNSVTNLSAFFKRVSTEPAFVKTFGSVKSGKK